MLIIMKAEEYSYNRVEISDLAGVSLDVVRKESAKGTFNNLDGLIGWILGKRLLSDGMSALNEIIAPVHPENIPGDNGSEKIFNAEREEEVVDALNIPGLTKGCNDIVAPDAPPVDLGEPGGDFVEESGDTEFEEDAPFSEFEEGLIGNFMNRPHNMDRKSAEKQILRGRDYCCVERLSEEDIMELGW